MDFNKKYTKYLQLRTSLNVVDAILECITALDQAKTEKELDQIFPSLIRAIGEYTLSDRCYIFEWTSESRQSLRMTYEWCEDGVRATIHEMQEVFLNMIPNLKKYFDQGKPVVSHNLEKDREFMQQEYQLFLDQNIESLIVIPIFSNNILNGFIGIDNPEQSTSDMSLKLLSAVGGHIGSLKQNLHMLAQLEEKQRELQNSFEELEKEKRILDTLCIDYTSVYYCDLIKDIIYPIKQEKSTNAFITEKYLTQQQHRYTYRIQYYFEHFVIHESAMDFIEKLSPAYLKEQLSDQDRIVYRFRTIPNLAGQEHFEVQIVRLKGQDGFKVVMGYRYIDDILQEQERQQTKLEKALTQANLNNEIISSISKIYCLIYRMDLKAGTYEEVSAGQEMHYLTGKHGNTMEVFQDVIETIVSEKHQDAMKQFLDISTLNQRLMNTESVGIEYQAKNKFWYLARFIVKKRDEQGIVTHVLYLVREINKQKQIELEYQEKVLAAAEDAKRANIAKTDFLRRMSHDIRTPINGILGMVNIAEHYPNDLKKQMECRNKVKEAAGFLLDLVSSILDMNKLESGEIILEHKEFDLLEILQETNHIIGMTAQEKNIVLDIDDKDLRHQYLIGSPLHLRQILQNISGNAVKYNKKGGAINIVCRENQINDDWISLEFICTDTGKGISKEFLEHVFEPFAQENTQARSTYMGSGLGLAIVKQLVELMGGEIKIESNLGVGTKVMVFLPFEIDHNYHKEDKKRVENIENKLCDLKVLLVEDNEINIEIARFMLERFGMKITEAHNGKEAMEVFQSSKENYFDMIFMDIMMPVMDGLEATRQIRKLNREDAKKIPIIAMTANAFSDDAQLSKEAGMDEHLVKPLDEKLMKKVVEQYF